MMWRDLTSVFIIIFYYFSGASIVLRYCCTWKTNTTRTLGSGVVCASSSSTTMKIWRWDFHRFTVPCIIEYWPSRVPYRCCSCTRCVAEAFLGGPSQSAMVCQRTHPGEWAERFELGNDRGWWPRAARDHSWSTDCLFVPFYSAIKTHQERVSRSVVTMWMYLWSTSNIHSGGAD